jgi:hypothetical protein
VSSSERADPTKPQSPPEVPPTAKQEKTEVNGTPVALAERLLAAGIPVVVCRPCPGYGKPGKCSWRGHDKGTVELHQPKGWASVTSAECDLSGYRPGVDTLAMVSGHGIDLVDVDTKAGGSVEHLPPFKSYGTTRTPSGGQHYVVPSSGFGKVSPFDGLVGHVGDYVGGRADGTGRLLGYLPGSTRPKYPGRSYTEELEWDIDGCLAAEPDPVLVAALADAGAGDTVHEEYIDTSPVRPVEDGVHPEAEKGVRRALDLLDGLPAVWSEGDHWDDNHHKVACILRRYANSNWSGYTEEQAEADYRAHARTDEGWGEDDVDAKWEAAAATVQGGGIEHPYAEFADDFDWDRATPPTAEVIAEVAAEAIHLKVLKYAENLRIAQAARELVAREALAETPVVTPTNLTDFLAEPDEDARYRVDRLLPTGGRVVFAAPNKAGKTTTIGNLVRCLVDGGQFLDEFKVEPAARVVLLDNELDPRMIRSWLRDQAIGNTDAVGVLSLRGRLSGFNILDPVVRAEWAAAIGPADLLVFDCLRPALDALGLSEDKDAGRFLVALDELIAEAGVQELVVVHHMGHTNERSRGDSRILDWPDALWKIVKLNPEDHASARFFSAYGRDVSHPESRLAYDPENRHLSLAGGSRHESRASQTETDVLDFIRADPGCSGGALERAVPGDNNVIRQAVRNLVAMGLVTVVKQGQKNAHYPADPGSDFAEEA